MALKLYDLVLENGCPMSPFVWRTKFALAHKGLPFQALPVGFSEIRDVAGGRFKTVPIIEDGEEAVVDSWSIADYLDQNYASHPPLFASPGERGLVRFFDTWYRTAVLLPLFRLYVLDIHNGLRPADQPEFRRTREARLPDGQSLESFTLERHKSLPAFRAGIEPLRATLRDQPFLGGERPNYADHIGFAGFLWAAAVNTAPPLEAGDPLLAWLERGFDAYDGLGRDERMRPLAA